MGACALLSTKGSVKTDASQDASVFGFGGSVFVPQPVLRFVLQGGEHHFPRVGIELAKTVEQILHLFTLGRAVGGAGRRNDGQLHFPRHVNDVLSGR